MAVVSVKWKSVICDLPSGDPGCGYCCHYCWCYTPRQIRRDSGRAFAESERCSGSTQGAPVARKERGCVVARIHPKDSRPRANSPFITTFTWRGFSKAYCSWTTKRNTYFEAGLWVKTYNGKVARRSHRLGVPFQSFCSKIGQWSVERWGPLSPPGSTAVAFVLGGPCVYNLFYIQNSLEHRRFLVDFSLTLTFINRTWLWNASHNFLVRKLMCL